jgi:hypothetical protein
VKIRLVFDDWQDATGKSIYSTEEGFELSFTSFHHGTTFDAEIETLGEDEFLRDVMARGYRPVFYAVEQANEAEEGKP